MHSIGRDTLVDGRYRVQERLGAGGMADVWCAQDEQLGRRVALKLLLGRFAADEAFRERFRREASAAAGLQHPNVVGIFDRGEWDGIPYIAMELVEGRTLKQLVQEEGPLEADRAIDLTEQVLRALRYAHRRGIVHRDVKPQNVILDDEGRAKVADFGIARAGASDMTETGSIVGTAQYLSPEQAQGHPVSPRSDLYSVGVLLYELLTGRVPFEAESAVTVALKQVSEAPVPPSQLRPGLPRALEAVVLRALEKDPARRYADADAFIAALEAARGAPPGPVREVVLEPTPGEPWAPVRDPGRRWWAWLLALLVLAALAVGAYLLLVPNRREVPNVVGRTSATAAQILHNRGFEVQIESVVNPGVPRDRVATQDPQPGEAAREGTTVSITVSAGPGEATVPAVAGTPRADAERALREAGFKSKVRSAASGSVPAGTVVRAEPVEGTVLEKGQTVTLVVSRGPARVAVPDVQGDSRSSAQGQLEAAGLRVSVREQETADADPGTVLEQAPAAGTRVKKGGTVQLTVAKAPPRKAVPDVTGQPEAAARAALEAAGFAVRTRAGTSTAPEDEGTVLAQAPEPGVRRTEGATVTLTVGGTFEPPAPDATPTPTPTATP